ncbi:sulfite exporter TauE/SafE family protein [Caldifermentibacillus hisashii]|uniref:sulfite exporter TauE/SafE family protein n=1 Tax=Caldifermentibacillus hisashii TaxID=996558 RepID=UPI0031FC43A1
MEYIALFFTGMVATTLGTLAGGGGLISLPIMLLLGSPIHSAIGANKVSNTVSAFSSFLYLFKHGQISIKESFWVIPISVIGGISGGIIASILSSKYLFIIAIFLLIFAFISSFLGKDQFQGDQKLTINKISLPGLYSIGIYDGLFGPGQGTLQLYLFGYLKISYLRAIAYSRLATFSSCFGAAVTYITTGHIIWSYTICLLLGSISGAQVGVRIAEKLKPNLIKPLLRVVTVALIFQIIANQISGN